MEHLSSILILAVGYLLDRGIKKIDGRLDNHGKRIKKLEDERLLRAGKQSATC
jgi:hypothetical protein